MRNEASAGCSSVELSTANVQYTRVCGRITGYQYSTLDGFNNNDINSAYVDGVSLTYGSPRQHIWSFTAKNGFCGCFDAPEIVGSDFFCDSGPNRNNYAVLGAFYYANPLWDGMGCSGISPYFLKTLAHPTSDNIEMRACRNDLSSNGDVAIQIAEIFIR